ncbi:hypothetical protein ABIB66_006183 [Bradyrhizobium sp. F1.13.3]
MKQLSSISDALRRSSVSDFEHIELPQQSIMQSLVKQIGPPCICAFL